MWLPQIDSISQPPLQPRYLHETRFGPMGSEQKGLKQPVGLKGKGHNLLCPFLFPMSGPCVGWWAISDSSKEGSALGIEKSWSLMTPQTSPSLTRDSNILLTHLSNHYLGALLHTVQPAAAWLMQVSAVESVGTHLPTKWGRFVDFCSQLAQ